MTTLYPSAYDAFTNPLAANPTTSPSHAGQHSDVNDAIEAVEAELGLNPSGSNATVAARFTLFDKWAYNVRDAAFAGGAKGDGSTDDTAAFLACQIAAAGRTWYVPPEEPGFEYKLSAPIPVTARTRVISNGAKVYQSASYKPVFDIGGTTSGDDVTIDGFELRTDAEAYSGTSFRSDSLGHYKSGVWAAGNRITVRNIRATNFFNGVKPNNWNYATGLRDALMTGLTVDGIDVTNVWVAVMLTGHENFRINGIRGSYARPSGSTDPAHLIYTSSNSTVGVPYPRNGTISNCVAVDGGTSNEDVAYSIKTLSNAQISNLTARNCMGLLIQLECTDVTINGLVEEDSRSTSTNGTIFNQAVLPGDMVRVHISNVTIRMATRQRAIRIDGTDCSLRNVSIDMPTAAGETIVVNGIGNVVENVKVTAPAGVASPVIVLGQGSGHKVRNIETQNGQYAVSVTAGVTGCVIEYDPTLCTGTLNGRVILPQPDTRLLMKPTRAYFSQAGGGYGIRAAAANQVRVSTTSGAALSINNSAEKAAGMTLDIEVANDSGGAMGAMTWGTDYELRTAWVNPAAGSWTNIGFIYNGTKWREQYRGV